MDVYGRMQSVVVYPLTTADIYSDAIRKQTESASTIELTLEDTIPGKPPKGSVLLSTVPFTTVDKCVIEYYSQLCHLVSLNYVVFLSLVSLCDYTCCVLWLSREYLRQIDR